MKKITVLNAILLAGLLGIGVQGYANTPLTHKQKQILSHAKKSYKNGWVHISIHGHPYERGFQYGYLIAKEYADAYRVKKAISYQATGVPLETFIDEGAKLSKGKIPNELMAEMRGIADGLTAAGVKTSLKQIIGWNNYTETSEYWWPAIGSKHYTKYVKPGLINYSKFPSPYANLNKSAKTSLAKLYFRQSARCSAFIATGKATKLGHIVIGHETFDDFWSGQADNIILDVTPTKGQRMIFQTPGYIQSGTDFSINSSGLVIVETTIANQFNYKLGGIPEFIRARTATQYAKTIPEFVRIMQKGNNGGYANTWLIGNINNDRIASFSQALNYQGFRETNDGYFTGANVSQDPRIRNVDGTNSGYTDTRQQTGARRTRWIELTKKYYGKIDKNVGMKMLADTYDVYLNKANNPSSRTMCAEYDKDPQPFVSDPQAVWNLPYVPAGSVDAKVTTSADAKKMIMWGRFGRANGDAFDANKFIQKHPEWAWQKGYLKSRPSESWAKFEFSK